MSITHRIRKAIIVAILITLVSLLGQVIAAPAAEAHNVTRARCAKGATAHIQSHGVANVYHWRYDFRRCLRYAAKHNLRHRCARPRPTIPYGITVKYRRATRTQRRNLTIALNVARRMRSPQSHHVALVAAATQESSAYNRPYGHGTSVGILQLISIHGTVAWRMRIPNSVGWFLRGARRIDPRGRRSPGRLAQDVQRSAHPTLYRQWVPESRRTVRRFYGPCFRYV